MPHSDPIFDVLLPAIARTADAPTVASDRRARRAASRATRAATRSPAHRAAKWSLVVAGGGATLLAAAGMTGGLSSAAGQVRFEPTARAPSAAGLPTTRPQVAFGPPRVRPLATPSADPLADAVASAGPSVEPDGWQALVPPAPSFAAPQIAPLVAPGIPSSGQPTVNGLASVDAASTADAVAPSPTFTTPTFAPLPTFGKGFTFGPLASAAPALVPPALVTQAVQTTPAPPSPTAARVTGDEIRPSTRPAGATAWAVASEGVGDDGAIRLSVNKTRVVRTSAPYTRVSVAQPDVADVSPLGPDELLVTAKEPGSTQLILWAQESGEPGGPGERSQVVDVSVEPDLAAVRDRVERLFPGLDVTITGTGAGLALTGTAPDLRTAEQVQAVVEPFVGSGGQVLNLLEVAGGQQVMLQVQFAEISRTVGTELGVSFSGTDGNATFGSIVGGAGVGVGNPDGTGLFNPSGPSPSTLFGGGTSGNLQFNYFVQALRNNNLIRVLAEPNVVAISGQEASFLAGGEFPIPVPQPGAAGGTGITIEYREFGVKLNFVPIVLGDGRIRLNLNPEVSDLDFSTAVVLAGTRVPGLRKRELSTTVELAEGQTFAVAGLLDSNVAANRDVVPLLGDIPILGALFRSVRYQRRETELVVLITPHLVEAMNPGEVPPLPGQGYRSPSEAELYLFGNLEKDANRAPDAPLDPRDRVAPDGPPATFEGRRGFQPAGSPSGEATMGGR